MKNILVPTDFSQTAFKALEVAADMALKSKALVHILHSYTLIESPFTENRALREAWNEQQKKEKWSALLELEQKIVEKYPGLTVEINLYIGHPPKAIFAFVQETGAELIVMGTQGASGLASVFIGSTTADIIAKSPIPVLAIPEEYEGTTPALLLLAINNFEPHFHWLHTAFDLADIWKIPIEVMVFTPLDEASSKKKADREQLETYTNKLQTQYPYVPIKSMVMLGDNFDDAMDEFLSQNHSVAISMITYKRGFWENLFNPSKTQKMAYLTHVPLLAIPANIT